MILLKKVETNGVYNFDKILYEGYDIDEQPNTIAKKQYVNGKRKKIQTEYTDVVININLGCYSNDNLSECLQHLKDGEYQYYSLKEKQYKNANFIVTLPQLGVESSSGDIIVKDFTVLLEKSGDVE